MRCLPIVVLAVLLAAPAAAPGQSSTLQTEARGWYPVERLVGPHLSGPDVVWAEQSGYGRRVIADGPGGRRLLYQGPFGGRAHMHLDAAGGRAALVEYDERCPPTDDVDDPCGRYHGETPVDSVVHAGGLDAPLAPLTPGCTATRAVVAADALALACWASRWRLLEDGAPPRTLDVYGVALAPGVIAAVEPPGNPIVVRRRPGDEELLRVEGLASTPRYDVAADGAVAYLLDERRIAWSSPGEPARHVIDVAGHAYDVKIEGDRIAVVSGRDGTTLLTVVRRDGTLVGAHLTSDRIGGWDFDGARLAWARQPCSRITVHVWDLAGAPPPEPGTGCTMPEALVERAPLPGDRTVRVPVACPPAADAGCGGRIEAHVRYVTRGGRRRFDYAGGPSSFDLDSGTRAALRFRLTRAVARARRASLSLTFRTPYSRDGTPRRFSIDLRLRR